MIELTPEQHRLVRYALGLPNRWRCSLRNAYFVATPGHSAVTPWTELVRRGLATEQCSNAGPRFFAATRALAHAVLTPGEGLRDRHFLWELDDD